MIEYCKAKKEDLVSITKVYIEVFSAPPRNEIIDFDELYESLSYNFDNGVFFIAKINNEVVGFVSLVKQKMTKDYKDLSSIFKSNGYTLDPNGYYCSEGAVLPVCRKKGVYQELYNLREAWAKGKTNSIYSRCRIDAIEINSFLEKNKFEKLFLFDFEINNVKSKKQVYLKKT